MTTKRPGIAAVAEEAGVSISTVSQVLSGTRPVSAATRARVQQAIDKLQYTPHPAARSLRNQRTESIALIVPDITNPFYPLAAVGMQEALVPAGFMLSVSDAALRSARVGQVVEHVLARRVDGIALGTYGLQPEDLEKIRRSGIPVVAFGRDVEFPSSDCVESDDEGGFVKVTEHLIQTGRRRIGFIAGEAGAHPNRLRVSGFRSVMSRAGLDCSDDVITHASFYREGGVRGVDDLYARSGDWDAIVCANDLVAIGAIGRLRERGLRVPDDVAVTGYDDIDAAGLITPSLTTVENPAREIGRTAAQLLLARLNGETRDDIRQHIVLSNHLIVRDSTAPTRTQDEKGT